MNAIVRQLEFYLSDFNLIKDEFTRNLLKEHNGQIPVSIFNEKFPKLAAFKQTSAQLTDLINEKSLHLKIDEAGKVILNREPRQEPISIVLTIKKAPFSVPHLISFEKQGDNIFKCYFYE